MASVSKRTFKRVLSLFSGCGGMDLGFEGGFEVPDLSINSDVNPDWQITITRDGWARVGETIFKTVFANDIRPDARTAWVNYFENRGTDGSVYKLGSIVDLVKKAAVESDVFPDNVDIVTGGFPCQDFSVAGKRLGFNSNKSHNGEKIDVADVPTIETRGSLYIWMREVIGLTRPKIGRAHV